MNALIVCDGASKGNPGRAGIGAVLELDGQTVSTISDYIGWHTCNEAEWLAALTAFKSLQQHPKWELVTSITVMTDSQLIVNQANGKYACNSKKLKPLLAEWKKLVKGSHKRVTVRWSQDVDTAHDLADMGSTRYGRQ